MVPVMWSRLALVAISAVAFIGGAPAVAGHGAAVTGPGVVFSVFEGLPPSGACPGLYVAEERTRRITWLGGWDEQREDSAVYPSFTSRGTLSYGHWVDPSASVPLVDVYAGGRRVARPAFARWAWSPRREELAYGRVSADGRRLELVLTTTGGATRVLAPSIGIPPVWLPDGSGLVYVRRRGSVDVITFVSRDGRRRRDLARNGGEPVVSPDGRRVAFLRTVSKPSEKSVVEVWVVPTGGGRARKVVGPVPRLGLRLATWLSKRELLLQRGRESDSIFNAGETLNRLDVDTLRERPFLKRAFALSVSPDRKRLLFVRSHTAAGETYYSVRTVDVTGRNGRLLGVVDEEDLNIGSRPVWKPPAATVDWVGDAPPAPRQQCERRLTAARDATP